MKVDESCGQFLLADMTGEGKNSIMLFSLAAQNVDANAKMLQYDIQTKQIFTRSSVAMSNSANSFVELKYGRADESRSGVFVDTLSVSREGETQFIYWDEALSTLSNPLNTQNGTVSTNPTIRANDGIVSIDINDDGIIELPTLTRMPHTSNENIDLVAFESTWNHYNPKDNDLTPVFETVTELELGYYFIIPKEWQDSVTVRYSLFGNSLTFYLWNEQEESESDENIRADGTLGDKLLTIQVFTAKEWTSTENKDFIEIGDYGDRVYAVSIPSETAATKKIAMSLNKIPDYFYLIN